MHLLHHAQSTEWTGDCILKVVFLWKVKKTYGALCGIKNFKNMFDTLDILKASLFPEWLRISGHDDNSVDDF